MNRPEFIATVADKSGFSKKETDTILKAMLSTITETLAAGDNVQFVGFGTFETRNRSKRQGINPSNGEKITIPAKRVPVFKTGACLKKAITDFDSKPKRGKKKK